MKNIRASAKFISLFVCFLFTQKCLIAQSDDSYSSVYITATRTVRIVQDESKKVGDCNQTQKGNNEINLQLSLNCDKIYVTNQSDYFNIDVSGGQVEKQSLPFSGGGTINASYSSELNECTSSTTSSGSGSLKLEMNDYHFSFTYDRSKKQGDYALQPSWGGVTGSGTLVTRDKNGSQTADASAVVRAETNLLGNTYGQFSSSNYSQYEKLGLSPQVIEQMNKGLFMGGNGDLCSISETKTGFEVGFSASHTFNKDELNVDQDWNGTYTITITTQLHISVGAKPKQYDAILEPFSIPGTNISGDYENWIPQGPPPPSATKGAPSAPQKKGNSIGFKVYIVDKNNPDEKQPDVKFDVDYTLSSSHEPGYCNNYPLSNPDESPDLRFDSIMQSMNGISTITQSEAASKGLNGDKVQAIITSYDYGSFGKLKAVITLENGGDLVAHFKNDTKTEISLPKDENNNQIADAWEKQRDLLEKDYGPDYDSEHQDGNDHDGDGLTYYEEYRGWLVKNMHTRLDPKQKKIIIGNETGQNLDAAYSLFESASGIKCIEVIPGKEIDETNAVANKNSAYAHDGDQHGIIVKALPIEGDTSNPVLGQVFVKSGVPPAVVEGSHIPSEPIATSPKEVDYLDINSKAIKSAGDFNYTFAHEIAHCFGVRHHGDSKPYFLIGADRYMIQDTNFKYISEAGVPQDKQKLIELISKTGQEAALPYSQSSGNDNCIMCYNQEYEFSFPLGVKGKVLVVTNLSHPNGITFCKSSAGTGRNDAERDPGPVFGDAEKGNCMSQFQVKDY